MVTGSYQLLDSGNFQKLEQVGPYRIVRPSLQAIWRPALADAEWTNADAKFVRFSGGDGEWQFKRGLKQDDWRISLANIVFNIKLTDFGHLGLFSEQRDNWEWIQSTLQRWSIESRELRVLNLFAYTGGSTLAAALGGAQVVHVDASKTSVAWARENALSSGLDSRPIRWIVEDVQKFVQRELRRGNTYHGIILDPPSYGRGPKGEIWKLEENLGAFMTDLAALLDKQFGFVLLSAHSPGLTPIALENILRDQFAERGGRYESAEMLIHAAQDRHSLPSGAYSLFVQEP